MSRLISTKKIFVCVDNFYYITKSVALLEGLVRRPAAVSGGATGRDCPSGGAANVMVGLS